MATKKQQKRQDKAQSTWASHDVGAMPAGSSNKEKQPATFVDALKSYIASGSNKTSKGFSTTQVKGTISTSAAEAQQDKKGAKKRKGKPGKKVRMSRNDGLLLLLGHYVGLSRKGATGKKGEKKTKTEAMPAGAAAAQEPVAELTAEKKTKVEDQALELTEDSAADRHSKRMEKADNETEETKDEAPVLEGGMDLDGTLFDGGELLGGEASSEAASGDMGMQLDLDDEDFYVDMPESLTVDSSELAELSKTISVEEIEDAANFLGVFEGSVNLDQFTDYMPEEELKAHEQAKAKRETKGTKKDAAAKKADGKEGEAGASGGFGVSQLRAMFEQQKQLLSKLTAVSSLPIFNPEKLKQLMEALPAISRSSKKAAPTAEADAKKAEAEIEAEAPAEGAIESIASEEEVAAAEDAAAAAEVIEAAEEAEEVVGETPEVDVAALQQQVAEEGFLESTGKSESDLAAAQKEVGQAGALPGQDEPGELDLDLELSAPESAAAKQAQANQVEEPKQKRGFKLFGRSKKGKEPAAEPEAPAAAAPAAKAAPERLSEKELASAMENEGFLESTTRKKADDLPPPPSAKKKGGFSLFGKKSDATDEAPLKAEMAKEDFLESTTPQDDVSLADLEGSGDAAEPAQKLSARELRAIKRQKLKEEKAEQERQVSESKRKKEEEKRWAEEAKRREKMIEEQRKQRAEESKKLKKKGDKVEIKMPQKKKVGSLQGFMMSLNYMGMDKDRSAFIENLGVMMDAGLPLLDALRALEMETKNKQMKKLLSRMVVAVETGSSLWRAMEAQYFFAPQHVAMVRVGEESGNLVENLHYLTEQDEKQRSLRSKVKTAMIYPIIIFTMLTLIVLGLGMFVLPNLIQVIFSLGVPLPFITRMIVKFTNFFSEHGMVFVPSLFGGMVMLAILNKYTSFKVIVQWILYKIPGIGVLIKEAALSQFGVTMGGLMQAGVPVTDALESVADVTSLTRYKKFYYLLLEHVKLGDSFTTSFEKIKSTEKCFPTGMQQLIRTGEKSGSLTEIMLKLADIHDKKASDVAEKLPVILEPMLLLFIGGLVGTIALGILAPIYSVVGNVGN